MLHTGLLTGWCSKALRTTLLHSNRWYILFGDIAEKLFLTCVPCHWAVMKFKSDSTIVLMWILVIVVHAVSTSKMFCVSHFFLLVALVGIVLYFYIHWQYCGLCLPERPNLHHSHSCCTYACIIVVYFYVHVYFLLENGNIVSDERWLVMAAV